MIKLCYNANGLRNMAVVEAIDAVKNAGYEGIELALHSTLLHPFHLTKSEIANIKNKLISSGLFPACLATGCDNILSDRRFEPSLICNKSEGRKYRIKLLNESIKLAKKLGFKTINFASGFKDSNLSIENSLKYLKEGISELLNTHPDIVMAIEPEPDMFIGTSLDAIKLIDDLGYDNLKLNLDIGHVYCCEDNFFDKIEKSIPYTVHMHIEDIKNKVHYHEIPGDGEINFNKVLEILMNNNYKGYISVELYHHSNKWKEALQRSHDKLSSVLVSQL